MNAGPDWTDFVEEIAALARAGLPLEPSLERLAGELPRRLVPAVRRTRARLDEGMSLADALAKESPPFPPLLVAVARAGARAGRLPAALERMVDIERAHSELRRSLAMAFWYPIVVTVLAYAFSLVLLLELVPAVAGVLHQGHDPLPTSLRALLWLSETSPWWGPVLPLGCLVVFGLAMVARKKSSGGRWNLVCRLPWLGESWADGDLALFCEVLGLLMENDVPLDEGLELAGAVSGRPEWAQASKAAANAARSGAAEELALAEGPIAILSRLELGEQLPARLQQEARRARRRVADRADFARGALPPLLVAIIGGTAVLGFGLLFFTSLLSLWGGFVND